MELHILAYAADGDRVKDIVIESGAETPEFYAHQLLHVDGVVCVQIFPLGRPGQVVAALTTRCDPGVDWDTFVTEKVI